MKTPLILNESNYFSPEANKIYCSSSQYRDFCGTVGRASCEARAMAKIRGEWTEEPSTAMLVGSYIDSHFSGTLGTFKAQNPDIFTTRTGKNGLAGTLKSDYVKANLMIARIERDAYFMKTLSGGVQKIFTVYMFGTWWKCKIDSFHEEIAIVDLKSTKSITETHWVKDLKDHVSFVEYWGYEIQGAIYQKIVEIKTGKKLPFLIGAVSKEDEPDIEIIGFDQKTLDNALINIELAMPRIIALKSGEEEPQRCGVCDYCKHTKVLTGPVHFSKLAKKV